MISEKGQVFLEAWKLHDQTSERISNRGEVEAKNGRRYWPGWDVLQIETDEHVRTLQEYALELTVSPVILIRTLHELRRDGVDHEKAIRLVVEYLETLK